MTHSYQHWDDARTISQMFGDVAAVRTLVEVFLDHHEPMQHVLDDAGADIKAMSDTVHTLRSLFAIFNAHPAYELAVEMDRFIRDGRPVTELARVQLADELRAIAGELEHYLLQADPPNGAASTPSRTA